MAAATADKVALVTGGASGIGRATALAFAARGSPVVVADVDRRGGRETATLIERSGQRAIFVRTDVTRERDCAALVEAALDRYGGLDIAFNNAGVAGYPLLTADYGAQRWQQVIGVNLTGVFNCMTHELRAMQRGGGAIVNTASIMGLVGTPGGAAYCASKHGVLGLTKAAALEYGRNGIRVNAICPGYVETGMTVGETSMFTPKKLEAGLHRTALRRLARPAEIAELVVWLCSDSAAYVTGASYAVDGGYGAA